MELLLRVEVEQAERAVDVSVTLEPSHTVAELTQALAEYCECAPEQEFTLLDVTADRRLQPTTTADKLGLISGDVLRLESGSNGDVASPAPTALRLAITFGPNAGDSHQLSPGRYLIGRDPACQIVLQDPQIAKQHLMLAVGPELDVSIAPIVDDRNEVRVNGQKIEGVAPLRSNDLVHLGASAFAIRAPVSGTHVAANLFGYIPFHRAPYYPTPVTKKKIDAVKDVPGKPSRRRLPYLAALAPLLMGITMATLFKRPYFLVFAIFSPVMALGSYLDGKRHGGKDQVEKVEKFTANLETHRQEIDAALVEERRSRVHNGPDLEDLRERAKERHETLWVRDRKAIDFLTLRTGVGNLPPEVEIGEPTTGEQKYLDQRTEKLAGADELADVPITVSLTKHGTVAVVGEPHDVTQLVASLALQASCLHSPEDLVIAAAISQESGLTEWLKWLPHARSSSSPLAEPHLVVTPESGDNLLRRILQVAESRAGSEERKSDQRWPWLLFFIDLSAEPDAAIITRLLDLCPEVGISVVWLSSDRKWVPRQATAVLTTKPLYSGHPTDLSFTDPEIDNRRLHPERVEHAVAEEVGRTLAPVQDASSSNAATAIPRIVPLFTSLGIEGCSPEWIAQQWMTDRGYSLQAPIGMTETGPLILDMVEHGPHGLIGGTSGAGKSELLQSIVTNMIAYNPPTKINFLFVDYKGGASSDLFKNVPHTVGYVTNLDAILSLRALTSLTAELNRRMALMQGKAKDLAEMIEKYPDEAPPSLVIIVDEFATLVKALPEFVDGVVDIAQRGRSLGIHLILSTQRPSGAVNDNILANTNLRISLRMLDVAESRNVIDTADAAHIPGPLKGRGFARLGPGELIAFQSAWSGAPVLAAKGPPPVDIRPFSTLPEVHADFQQRPRPEAPVTESGSKLTQVDVVLDSIVEAAEMLGIKRGRSPWQDVLPDVISLVDVLADERSRLEGPPGRSIVVGTIDDPEAQDQYPAIVDLEAGGGLLIFGVGGSGKSTLLQTLALSASINDSQAGGGNLTVFALDFASRQLVSLAKLPQCGAVATGDDIESVTRIIALLSSELNSRRTSLAAASAKGEDPPEFGRVLLLLDGYENIVQTMEQNPHGGITLQPWLERLNSLISDGRQVGIHVALAASRRGAVRTNIMSVVTNRVVLSQAEDSGYTELGVPTKMAKGIELDPGRGFINGSDVVQLAMWTGPEAQDQADVSEKDSMASLFKRLKGSVDPKLVTKPLPLSMPALEPSSDPNLVPIGVADLSMQPVELSLEHNHVLVIGPPRSGRSTALAAVAEQAMEDGKTEVWLFGQADSPLRHLAKTAKGSAFGKAATVALTLEELATLLETFPDKKRLIVFDDVDQIDDKSMHQPLDTLLDSKARVIGSVTTVREYNSNPLYQNLKKARSFLHLMPDHPRDVQEITGVLPPIRPGLAMVAGRGVLVANRVPTVLQVCMPNAELD